MNLPSRQLTEDTTPRPTAGLVAPAGRDGHLIALDVDGTLLDGEHLAPDVRAAVSKLAARMHVVLATGRCVVSTKLVADRLGLFDGYAVCSNGAAVVHLGTGEPVLMTTFEPGPAVRTLLQYMPAALVAVEEFGVGYRVSAPFPPGELTGIQRVQPLDELLDGPAPRVVVCRPGWSAASLHEVLARVGLHGVTYAVGTTAWLDLTPDGVTKAAGLEHVRSWLDVPPHRTTAIGDGHNDIDMLRWAHQGLAMAEAAPEVQAAADAVIGSVRDAAVARELTHRFG
ncbi:MAG: HAD hydrolase family protein [Streptosporangiales bacterium]|nr:HAD hydrolase family protein [Streptosporangiales bacterium]